MLAGETVIPPVLVTWAGGPVVVGGGLAGVEGITGEGDVGDGRELWVLAGRTATCGGASRVSDPAAADFSAAMKAEVVAAAGALAWL
jgi:hypothetical protein